MVGLWTHGADAPERVLACVTLAYFLVGTITSGFYLYAPEIYPTRARSLAVGVVSAWLRLASIIGPMVVGDMVGPGLQSMFLALGIVALLGAVVTELFAVETSGRVLEEVSPWRRVPFDRASRETSRIRKGVAWASPCTSAFSSCGFWETRCD